MYILFKSTHILFLNEKVDCGKVSGNVLGDDLRFNFIDPAIDVIAGLLVQNMFVRIEQFQSFGFREVLQVLPLFRQFIQSRLDNLETAINEMWPQTITLHDKMYQAVFVNLSINSEMFKLLSGPAVFHLFEWDNLAHLN